MLPLGFRRDSVEEDLVRGAKLVLTLVALALALAACGTMQAGAAATDAGAAATVAASASPASTATSTSTVTWRIFPANDFVHMQLADSGRVLVIPVQVPPENSECLRDFKARLTSFTPAAA